MELLIDKDIQNLASKAEEDLKENFKHIDTVCQNNSLKVINAFLEQKVVYSDFAEVNGYGFFDSARDKVEAIFAKVLGAEDALIRPHSMSGTNAIYITLSALLNYGDTMLCITGAPYDPLQEIMGIRGNSSQSLKNKGVKYEQIDLIDSDFDYNKIKARITKGDIKLVEIQRSCGYSDRKGINVSQIAKVCELIKEVDSSIIIMCDNCYGELVEDAEPTQVGVDIICGSLMHNIGGGVATSGGYIAGKQNLIDIVADRLTAPGIGKYLGADYNQKMKILKGLYMAPTAVANALKIALITGYIAEHLGFNGVCPKSSDIRSDIVQTFNLKSEEQLIDFCTYLQNSSPVDSFYTPTPCEMPAYPHAEIMSAGTFAQGSTIELTSDAPVTPPYKVFVQGGISYQSGKLSIISAFSNLKKKYNLQITD